MDQSPDFVVRVATSTARMATFAAAVSCAGAVLVAVMVGYLETTITSFSHAPGVVFFFPVLAAGLLASSGVMVGAALAEFRHLRNPPILTAEGLRMRAFARRGYDVLVPWTLITRLRVTEKGARPFLLVHVTDPAEFVPADHEADHDRAARRLNRTETRFGGAAFVYGLRSALVAPEEIDEAARRLSEGRVTLEP
jgi:hypothetical protein